MTYTINQDFMDTLEAMINCYSDLVDYYPDNERFWGTWLTLEDIKIMITTPEVLEEKKEIFLNK